MAITEIYVDPAVAGPGTGTLGDPHASIEYAIVNNTFDTVNGTRINVKTGTDDVLTAQLDTSLADVSVSVAWTPSEAAPLVIQGYTSAAGDGGVGGISGGGSVSIINTTRDYIYFVDMHLHNTGTNQMIVADDHFGLIRCEINNSTYSAGGSTITVDDTCFVSECYLHNLGTGGAFIRADSGSHIEFCYIEANGSSDPTALIQAPIPTTVIRHNILVLQASSANDGISGNGDDIVIDNNSVYVSAGTGIGIQNASNAMAFSVRNNLVEGFSGTGGIGIDVGNNGARKFGNNSVYNCETAFGTVAGVVVEAYSGNETLSASPFTNASGGDFRPVDTGSVKEGSAPTIIGGGYV